MKHIEEIILENSGRGMDVIREYMDEDFCREAAEEILRWKRGNVILTTGFYVAGHGESDGPTGTLCLARALEKLGFRCIIVTDETCEGYFELMGMEVVYLHVGDDDMACHSLIERYQPVGMISVERCGKNIEGYYANMRNCNITSHVAPADRLFEMEYGITPFEGEVACKYGITYSSIMGRGVATIIEDVETKKIALSSLMKTQTGKDFEFEDRMAEVVGVVKIDVLEFTAKHRPLPKEMR